MFQVTLLSPIWAKSSPFVASIQLFFSLEPSAIQFLLLGALHRSLTLKGASSEFRTLGVIYSGGKDKKKHVTKTTVDTFTARHGLSSMEKKACNYVPSLAAMQLLDYRDRTCTRG